MEYLPFRRMDLQSDGSWKPIIWPLPMGEVRDVPENVCVLVLFKTFREFATDSCR